MSERLTLVFFLLLFPGLFFYSSAVGARLIPAVIGGGFGLAAIIALVTLLPILMISAVRLKGTGLLITSLFFALIAYSAVWLLIHYLLGDPTQKRSDVITQWATLIATWLTLFSIGYFWPATLSNRYVAILIACLVGIAAVVVLNVDYQQRIFRFGISDAAGALSYQGLARSTAVTGLVLLSVIRSIRSSIIVAILLLTALFFIGARSEIVGVVAVLPFIFYLHYRQRPLATITAALVSSLIIIGAVVYSYDILISSRQFQLLNISESSSWMARAEMQEQALEAIKQAPFLGDFGGHARDHDGVGAYAHNVLSAWRQLGLVGFVLYLSLLFSSPLLSLYMVWYRRYDKTDLPRIAGTLSLFFLILMLGAKSVFSAFPALAWGLIVACYRHKPITKPAALPAKRHRRVFLLRIS